MKFLCDFVYNRPRKNTFEGSKEDYEDMMYGKNLKLVETLKISDLQYQ